MKKLIVGALACVGLAACFTPCPAIDCADAITISVKDSSGQPVTSFSGKATTQGREIQISCGGADAGVTTADGGTQFLEQAGCGNGEFMIFGGTGSGLNVDLHSGNLSYVGSVHVDSQTNAVGDPRCSTNCTSGTGAVTMQ